jgi:acyl carrier protein phosphodiesterase
MGDFVKGRPEDRYDGELLDGILLHRKVDAYTDDHEIFWRSRGRVRAPHRRFSGILIDIFYDHFLAKHWLTFSSVPLRDFADGVYSAVKRHEPLLPFSMLRFTRYMIETDLLVSYRETSGIAQALRGISTRLSRPNPLASGITALQAEYHGFEEDFLAYFPEVLAEFESEENR